MRGEHPMSPADIRFLQNLAYLVPGSRAYRDVELRRGEDSRLRARLLAALKAQRDRLAALEEAWQASETEPRWVARLQELQERIRGLCEDLRFGSPRAEAFFRAPVLPHEKVDEILEADLLLLEDLELLADAVAELPEDPPKRRGMRALLGRVERCLSDFAAHLVHRDRVLCSPPGPGGYAETLPEAA
jgi:hypothetical protein